MQVNVEDNVTVVQYAHALEPALVGPTASVVQVVDAAATVAVRLLHATVAIDATVAHRVLDSKNEAATAVDHVLAPRVAQRLQSHQQLLPLQVQVAVAHETDALRTDQWAESRSSLKFFQYFLNVWSLMCQSEIN